MKLTRPLFANSATGKVGEIGHIRAAKTGFCFIKKRQESARFTAAGQANRDFFAAQYAAFCAAGYRLNASWVYWLRQVTATPPVNHGSITSGKILNTLRREAPEGAARGNLSTGSVLSSIRATAPAPVARGNLTTGRILISIKKT